MSNFNQPCGNYLSLFYKSSLSSSLSVFLSYRFFTNNQSEPPQKEREKKQLRDRRHPPEKIYNGDRRQVI